MKDESLEIPSDILTDKNLNLNQKFILSALSTEPKMHFLNLAKKLGTKRASIRDDLEELVSKDYVISINGGGRVAYSRSRGFGFVGSEIKAVGKELQERTDFAATDISGQERENREKQKKRKKERTKEKKKSKLRESKEKEGACPRARCVLKRKRYVDSSDSFKVKGKIVPLWLDESVDEISSKLVLSIKDITTLAFHYWCVNGGIIHKRESGVYRDSMKYLRMLLKGVMFEDVLDNTIYKPLLNKKRKFTLEDWKTSIDNLKLAEISASHAPFNKAKFVDQNRKRSLKNFIYNPYIEAGSNKSMFLQFLEPPEHTNAEIIKYPRLTGQMIEVIGKVEFHTVPDEPVIISASNKYGDLISKHPQTSLSQIRWGSVHDAAKLFAEYIEKEFTIRKFNPSWMTSSWFFEKFELWLDKMGLINLGDC